MQLMLFLQLWIWFSPCNYFTAFLAVPCCRFDFSATWRTWDYHFSAAWGAETPTGIIRMSAVRTANRYIRSFHFMLRLAEPAGPAERCTIWTVAGIRRNYGTALGTGRSQPAAASYAKFKVLVILWTAVSALYGLLHLQLVPFSSALFLKVAFIIIPYATCVNKSRHILLMLTVGG